MKNILYFALAVIFLASCATPNYTYNFDKYDYNSGRKASTVKPDEASPLQAIAPEAMTADASGISVPVAVTPTHATKAGMNEAEIKNAKEVAAKKYSAMSKAERKEFRKEVKEQIKAYSKAIKSGEGITAGNEAAAMDNDLKLAIIFGAVGLTLTLFGGINEAFWILGVIAIVVGVVFLVKWLVRQ